MVKNTKQTSKAVVSKASEVLRNKCYNTKSQSVVGNALAQTKKKQVSLPIDD